MKNNCLIEHGYRSSYVLKEQAEGVDDYGEEYVYQFGYVVPAELIERYKTIYKEFKSVQEELRAIYNDDSGKYRG